MSSKQKKNHAYKKKLVHPTLTHDGMVVPQFSSLESADGVHLSAYHVASVMSSAVQQWATENDTVYGAYPVWRRDDVVRLVLKTIILDLSSIEQEPKMPLVAGKSAQGTNVASIRVDSSVLTPSCEDDLSAAANELANQPPIAKTAAETPAPVIDREMRRQTMLKVRELLQADAEGTFTYHEDVEVLIQAMPDPALARALVYGVKKGNVTQDPEGDIDWGDVQPIKRKLPLRDDLVVDAKLLGFHLGQSRKLSLSVLKVHSSQYKSAVATGTSKYGVFSVTYDSSRLETRIMQITAAGFDIQYRATVSRGLGRDDDLDFLVHEADPIVDGQALSGLSDAALLSELLLDTFKRKVGLV